MTKSIRVHNALCALLFVSYLTSSQPPTITLPDLSACSLEKAQAFAQEQGGSPFRIEIVPQQSYLSLLSTYFSGKAAQFRTYFSLTSLAKKTAIAALSLGGVSYVLCAYIIYKAFDILHAPTSWVSWCSDQELLLASDEYLYRKLTGHISRTHKKKLPYTSLLTQLQEEEEIIKKYCSIDSVLRTYKLRHLLPYSTKKHHSEIQMASEKIKLTKILLRTKEKNYEA